MRTIHTTDGNEIKIHTVDDIIAFEQGELTQDETLSLFASLIKTGQCWSLQGSYGRCAKQLIDGGWISSSGEILKNAEE